MIKKTKNPRPLISVITVCYNAKDYIEQCMQSVIKQDYGNYEYVIIDGGSTDGTKETLEKYKENLSYWHSKSDRGLAHAFNEGVLHSKGIWLIFLNSDDYFLEEGTLKTISDELLNNDSADVIFGQVNIVSREKTPHYIGGPYGGEFNWNDFLYRDTIPHQAAFTNRRLFEQDGLFDENFNIALDYEHYLRKGPALRATYVSQTISCMRDGGLSQESIGLSIREQHLARITNEVMPSFRAYRIYVWVLFRAFAGRYAKKFLKFAK